LFESAADRSGTATHGSVAYAYDGTGQLTGATYTDFANAPSDETFGYDAMGNRDTTDYSTGDHNQTTAAPGGFVYAYDDEGNRETRTNAAADELVEYEWDNRNRLTAIRTYDTSGPGDPVLGEEILYTYDAFNRRILKQVDENADTTVDVYEGFVYDGPHIALQFDGQTSADLTNRYLHGPAIDQILADEQVDWNTGTSDYDTDELYWPLADNLGTIRDVVEYVEATDTTIVANHIVYTVFGNIEDETDDTILHTFSYTGRERDYESDLTYYRARYYDAILAKFLNPDPKGFGGGDMNLYRYVGNSATNAIDPSGMRGEGKRTVTVVFKTPEELIKAGVNQHFIDELDRIWEPNYGINDWPTILKLLGIQRASIETTSWEVWGYTEGGVIVTDLDTGKEWYGMERHAHRWKEVASTWTVFGISTGIPMTTKEHAGIEYAAMKFFERESDVLYQLSGAGKLDALMKIMPYYGLGVGGQFVAPYEAAGIRMMSRIAQKGTSKLINLAKKGNPGLQPTKLLYSKSGHAYGFIGKNGKIYVTTGDDFAADVMKQFGFGRFPVRPGGTGAAYNELTGQGIYILRDSSGTIRYVGRGDGPQRLLAHARPGSGKEDLVGEILFNNNLLAEQAKSLEQELMHMLGGPKSVNPSTSLRNKIQGIGESNPSFLNLEFAADDELVIEALRRAGILER